jgi:hypothetical protein
MPQKVIESQLHQQRESHTRVTNGVAAANPFFETRLECGFDAA